MTNMEIRRTIKKYAKHYPGMDTRHMISVMAKAYSCMRQKIAANLGWARYEQRIKIRIKIEGEQSDLWAV